MIETIDIIRVMRKQEDSDYQKRDYFSSSLSQRLPLSSTSCNENTVTTSSFPTKKANVHKTDITCRDQMVAWCVQLVDYLHFQHETVEITMSLLDRFMTTGVGKSLAMPNRKVFQLACMACLYTTIKVHESTAVDSDIMSALSRRAYSVQQIEEMELTVLHALKWKIHPPTSLSYVRQCLEFLPQSIQEKFFARVKLQCELALKDYKAFGTTKASLLAYCALMNELASFKEAGFLTKEETHDIEETLRAALSPDSSEDSKPSDISHILQHNVERHDEEKRCQQKKNRKGKSDSKTTGASCLSEAYNNQMYISSSLDDSLRESPRGVS